MIQQKSPKLYSRLKKDYNKTMSIEKPSVDQTEHKAPVEAARKTHHTHFPVLKIHLKDSGTESLYEWVRSGVGRLTRVLKVPKK
jgi:hypothetical protein